MVGTRQKVPVILDEEKANAFTDKWDQAIRSFISKNV